jgi:hypothetical protein
VATEEALLANNVATGEALLANKVATGEALSAAIKASKMLRNAMNLLTATAATAF